MKTWVVAAVLALTPTIGHAQGLTAEEVAAGFEQGVALCAKAVSSGTRLAQLPETDRALFRPSAESPGPMSRVPEGSTGYDVVQGAGIVLLIESAAECRVTGYGPRVRPTFAAISSALARIGFTETRSVETPSAIIRTLEKAADAGGKTIVNLVGGEPGMAGHSFRFPSFSAYVSSAPRTPL